MVQSSLNNIFESFIERKSIFQNKDVLNLKFSPENIPHREKEINQIASILGTSLRLEKPSNIFIYGKPGTGKSLCASFVLLQLNQIAIKKSIPLKTVFINCKLGKIADTEYRLLAQLAREFGKNVPNTGLPTSEIYKAFYNEADKEKRIILIILDEIDQLVKKCGDEVLYNLTRINQELKRAEICLVGISNDLNFLNDLDPRVKSSLSEEEIFFSPYDAIQLKDILLERAKLAFNESVIGEDIISKCAAYAAREHGDARRALDLLRVSAELADRNGDAKINEIHIDMAEEKIEKDKYVEIVKTLPEQTKILLEAGISILSEVNRRINTGELFNVYKTYCIKYGIRPLTQRRISNMIAELDMLGLLNAKVTSFGRYGRTKEISLYIPRESIDKINKILTQPAEK